MYYLVSVLIIIACVFIILIVLIQNSKGGGLASNFTGSNQIMGVRKTTDFLEKATWGLAIALLGFSLIASITIPRPEDLEQKRARLEGSQLSMPKEDNTQNFPTQLPDANEMPENLAQ
ncbi:MAG: preprotein translocase subunit SecG [Bacteroidota bacterium]